MPTITGVRCRPFPHSGRQQLLVDVETDDGLTGTGEAWWGIASGPAGDPSASFAPMVASIESLLAPRVLGRDATAIERNWQEVADWAYRYGDGGIITSALAGIDIALWDLAGKRLGVPVAELLGGSCHDILPAYASLPPLRDAALLRQACESARAYGFRAFKLHEIDIQLVREARRYIGPDATLMVDVNGHFDAVEAVAFGRAMADLDVLWYEEPVRPMRHHGLIARVAQQQPIPLAGGENEYTLDEFQRLLATGAMHWLQPEVTKIGGLTPARKVAALAETAGVALAPHNFRIGPSLYASIHWGFASPGTQWLELPWIAGGTPFPCGAALPPVADGHVTLPPGVGLGLG
ncbi:MAG: mandelate racemase/muconate lactonizing enzyme family protein [Dehalococcoidia bacterium]